MSERLTIKNNGEWTLPNQHTPKPFPTFDEFFVWYYDNNSDVKNIYNYFAQFGVREVFPEVGNEYEFSTEGNNWVKTKLGGFRERFAALCRWGIKARKFQPTTKFNLKTKI